MGSDVETWAPPAAVEPTADDVITALTYCRDFLKGAERVDQVRAARDYSTAIEAYTRMAALGREAELAAGEMVRRCERRLGELAQEMPKAQTAGLRKGPLAPVDLGPDQRGDTVRRVGLFVSHEARTDAYRFASVNDDDFEDALGAARDAGNMSRAGVRRELERAAILSPSPKRERDDHPSVERDPVHRKKRRIDPNRVVRESVYMLEGIANGLGLVSPADVTDDEAPGWCLSLRRSIRDIERFRKELEQ